MSAVESSPRGAPLMFLVAVLASWVLARAATFSLLMDDGMAEASAFPAARRDDFSHRSTMAPNAATHCQGCGSPNSGGLTRLRTNALLPVMAWMPLRGTPLQALSGFHSGLLSSSADPAIGGALQQSAPVPVAPMRDAKLIAAERGEPVERSARVQLQQSSRSAQDRWSADGWLLLRRDTSTSIPAGRPSYGRSQAGVALRYGFASSSPHRPQGYLRASAALAGAHDQEVALGLSARPLPGAMLRLAVEARASETVSGSDLRLAAYAITELPSLGLPFGARGEAYVQGGYVGGEFATPFVDGQVRAERTIARTGSTELSFGAGAWGGMQKDSGRLDAGPTAAATFRIGKGVGRIAADYRFRLAGDAEPSSGPALTLSAGF